MATRTTTRGTGFINPQTYAAANAGAGRQMADRLAEFLEQGQAGFNNDLSAAEDRFNSGVNAGAPTYNDERLSAYEANRRAQLENTDYKGPSSLGEQEGWADIISKGRRAEQNSALGADFYGRQALLQQQYGNTGPYSAGMSRFDSFLVGANGGQGRFDVLKNSGSGLVDKAVAADRASQERSKGARDAVAATRQRYADAAPRLKQEEEERYRDELHRDLETSSDVNTAGRRKDRYRPYSPP